MPSIHFPRHLVGSYTTECSKYCSESLYYNWVCDSVCNTIECNSDNYNCECAPGCTASLLYNKNCDSECDNKACNYDRDYCTDDTNATYINLLTIIGFIIIGISFCLILTIMIWYYRRRRLEVFQRVADSEHSLRLTISELNSKYPESKCSESSLGQSCAICLDEYFLYRFINESLIRKLGCSHLFHSTCIQQWLIEGNSRSCPMCKTVVLK